MLIGVAAVVLGGFFIICAAPFASHRLYKAGGGLFLASGEIMKWLNPQVHFKVQCEIYWQNMTEIEYDISKYVLISVL